MRKPEHRILAILRKEILHILHDFRTLFIVFLIPVIQLLLFGYALNLEIQQVNLAVSDYAQSPVSRHLIEAFKGSKFFHLFYFDGQPEQIESLFEKRQAKVAIMIPPDFAQQLLRQSSTPVQFLIDASDANAATLIRNYCNQVLLNFNQSSGNQIPLPFDIRSTVFFNPEMKSSYFFVPGIIAMILIMISALLTSITIAREKETGTMEQILVSPVHSAEIVVGKVLPYILLAFIDGSIVLAVGIFVFGIPFSGSLLLLLILSILYIITGLSLGLLISTVARTQQVAMMVAMTATLLPTIMLSGLVFPIASMPKLLQYLSYLVPARFFLLIVRGIILKGSTFFQLLIPTIILAVMSMMLLNVSVRKFSLTLEK